MAPDPIYIGSDHNVSYTGAADSVSGSYLNSGTCTFVLKDADDATVSNSSGTASYVAASDGNYRGVIDGPTCTANLTDGAIYYVVITFVQSAYDDVRRIPVRAQYRTRT